MRWTDFIDYKELEKTISVLKPDHQLFEVRLFGADKRRVVSGYFTDSKTLIKALDTVDLRGKNLYLTLNKVNEALYSRTQHDRFVANVNTTSDPDIDRYEWLFIDLDPKRPTDVSSSDSELKRAEELKEDVKRYLTGMGFHAPVEALSGNGYHLLYKIDMQNDDDSKMLINNCLLALSMYFDNQAVKIDTVNYNPARICKLHGTLAQKGSSTADRPHRMSKLLFVPDPIEVNKKEILDQLAGLLPKQPQTQPARKPSGDFDIRDWLAKHGMTYKEEAGRDCQMFLLDECPFDASHRNGDSKIFAYSNGAIAFKCHHNSCRDKKWQDVRLKFEPDAYDGKDQDERIEAAYQKHKKQRQQASDPVPLPGEETKPKKKKRKFRKLKSADGLMKKDLPDPKVLVGVDDELPFLVEGTCILSAKPKLGKSWFALSLCLAIAKGEKFLGYQTAKKSVLYLDLETSEVIQKKRLTKVLKGEHVPSNLYIETETDPLDDGLIDQLENYVAQDPELGLIVIDVFQMVRSASKNFKESEYEHAYRDIGPLNEFAQKNHLAVVLVCHDRKTVDPDDPFSNILGSTGLQGAVSQMIVMYRKHKGDPIHVSTKGKTIDGVIDMNVKLDKAEWSKVDYDPDDESNQLELEYQESQIRKAVIEIAKRSGDAGWKGRCSWIIQESVEYDVPIVESAKQVGGFLHRHQGRFLKNDSVKISIINNGSGAKTYKICQSTVDTVDVNEALTVDGFEKADNYGEYEIPFV